MKEKLQKEFMALDVSSRDVAKAAIKLDISTETVRRYLRGKIGGIPTATALLNFFKTLK